jgi:hypothetical protein
MTELLVKSNKISLLQSGLDGYLSLRKKEYHFQCVYKEYGYVVKIYEGNIV